VVGIGEESRVEYKIYPLPVEVESGNVYTWCRCGKSTTHPLCDKEKGLCEQAVDYKARLNETLYFCSCGRTQNPPFCDGSHAKKDIIDD
jgi:CDGSH-type Zn-finger protein